FYLIIDDAHELDAAILTKLKYMSTFNHNEFFPFVMIFVGHPSFLQDLRTPALSSLNQRIKRRYHLAKFSLDDTKNYIYFRLLNSGATGIPAFPDETIQKIYEFSKGIPRLINNISDTCLLIGASYHLATIHPNIVDEAKNLVEGSVTETNTSVVEETGDPAEESLTEIEPAEGTGADSIDEGQPPITFSEYLPVGDAAKPDSIVSILMDPEEQKPQIAHPQVSVSRKKWGSALKMAGAAILLLLSGALLSNLFMYRNKIFTSFSPATQGEQQQIQTDLQPPPIESVRSTEKIPTLREELTDKTSGEITVPQVRMEAKPSVPSDTASRQVSGMDNQTSAKNETVSAGTSEPAALFPFSLRSSSYQQEEQALREISEVKQMGLMPYLVKADLGDMGTLWRVYIGFYSTEEDAKKIKATYKLTNATVQKTEYACQVGEFSNETDGLNMFEKLKKSGYYPYVIQKERARFLLYLGAYERKVEAEALQQALQKRGFKVQVVKR
ncbi:MAG: SPOR domain-containing protein, partial [Syntrophales bacterium LBB04]|nr:SPOR domain-containing protein [Syntrophales bacterium LBB04]